MRLVVVAVCLLFAAPATAQSFCNAAGCVGCALSGCNFDSTCGAYCDAGYQQQWYAGTSVTALHCAGYTLCINSSNANAESNAYQDCYAVNQAGYCTLCASGRYCAGVMYPSFTNSTTPTSLPSSTMTRTMSGTSTATGSASLSPASATVAPSPASLTQTLSPTATASTASCSYSLTPPASHSGQGAPSPAPSSPLPPATCIASAAEFASATLSCPTGATMVAVPFASYGLPTGACGSFVSVAACHAAASVGVVEAACLGRTSCTIFVSDAAFGDPCPGYTKHLSAQVLCGAPQPPSPSASPPPPGVTWLTVDGATVTGVVPGGGAAYFAYAQPLPYGVVVTLASLSGDADLYIGPGPPYAFGVDFAYTASSTNGDSALDAVACPANGPAVSASGGTGAAGANAAASSCWGPAATSTWYVQVAGWTEATFAINATSLLSSPLGVGSPQPSPGAAPALAPLALGVIVAGRLDVAFTSAYWMLSVPPAAAIYNTTLTLHITGPSERSDADLLAGLQPPFGAGNTEFASLWSSSRVGDDTVVVPPIGMGSQHLIVAVKAFAVPVEYTLLATTPNAGLPAAQARAGSGGAGTPSVVVIAPAVVLGTVAVLVVVLLLLLVRRRRRAAAASAAAAAGAGTDNCPPPLPPLGQPPPIAAATLSDLALVRAAELRTVAASDARALRNVARGGGAAESLSVGRPQLQLSPQQLRAAAVVPPTRVATASPRRRAPSPESDDDNDVGRGAVRWVNGVAQQRAPAAADAVVPHRATAATLRVQRRQVAVVPTAPPVVETDDLLAMLK